MSDIQTLFQSQKNTFKENHSRGIGFRKSMLRQLREVLKRNETELYEAIHKDFGKSAFETYETELAVIYHEIKVTLKNMKEWASVKRVPTNLPNQPGKSYIIPEPFGNTLVIAAWNYPYLLSLHPVISALAAGNVVIIKPSELAPNTSSVMAGLINSNFDKNYLHVVEGAVEETQALLKQPFDKIFFTGSPRVGKIVMEAAAQHLSSVTLELGGKSPAIILPDANLKRAVQRIVWGKFLNAGQTCIAPDYVLVHEDVKEEVMKHMEKEIQSNYGKDPSQSEAYTRIINQHHFERLYNLLEPEKVRFGGEIDKTKNYFSPTVMDNVTFEDKVMQEEIFGPILPVITFLDIKPMTDKIRQLPKPLALYLFTKSKKKSERILSQISFGGGAINDTIMHISNPWLPFGGVNNSGLGYYHGKAGFDTFSHKKSILKKSNLFEPFIKYPPYTKLKWKLIRWIME